MGLYFKYLSLHLKSQMQYRASFFMTSLSQLLLSATVFFEVAFMFSNIRQVEGFTFGEVLICMAVSFMSYALSQCFFRGFDQFPRMISNGEFDRVLVRPQNEIFQVLAQKIDFTRFGMALQALVILVYAMVKSGVVWNIEKGALLLMMIGGGAAVFSGVHIIYAAVTFFTIESLEFFSILTHGGREFGRYPFAIYGKGVLKFLTFVVPMALYQYYPLLYLTNRDKSVFNYVSPIISVLFLIPSYFIWRFSLKRYKSTGS